MSEFANNTTSSFLAGGLSTALAMTCVAPLVTINVRMMHDNPKIISSGNVVRYTGMVDCFTHIAREQGIKAFWRGNLINVIVFPPPTLSVLPSRMESRNISPRLTRMPNLENSP
jgi:Mitochondrial carrier protein.